jgi:predicted GTPase
VAGKEFAVVDTGGMIPAEQELIPPKSFVRRVAIEQAAHLIMVHAQQGIVPRPGIRDAATGKPCACGQQN